MTTTAILATPASDTDFAFTITPLTEYDNARIGYSLNYLFKVQNNGIYCNDFDLSRIIGTMDYVLYDQADDSSIDNFSLF